MRKCCVVCKKPVDKVCDQGGCESCQWAFDTGPILPLKPVYRLSAERVKQHLEAMRKLVFRS